MLLAPYLRDRSCYPEILLERLGRMEKLGGMNYDRDSQWYPMTDEGKRVSSGMSGLVPMSAALMTGFMVFKNAFPKLMEKAPTPVQALAKHPWMIPLLVGAGVGASVGLSHTKEPMPLTPYGTGRGVDGKNGAAYHGSKTAAAAKLGGLPLAYVHAGIRQRQWQPRERIKTASMLVAMRPTILAECSFDQSDRSNREFLKVGSARFDRAIIQSARRIAATKEKANGYTR